MSRIKLILVSVLFTVGLSAEGPKFRAVLSIDGLNIRKEPAADAARLLVVGNGEPLEMLAEPEREDSVAGVKGSWRKVRYGDIGGWAFSAYLTNFEFEKNCIKKETRVHGNAPVTFYRICGGTKNHLEANARIYYYELANLDKKHYLKKAETAWQDRKNRLFATIRATNLNRNVALVATIVPDGDIFMLSQAEDVWIYRTGYWELFDGNIGRGTAEIFDLNGDDLPDVATLYGCCDNFTARVYLGNADSVLVKKLDVLMLYDAKMTRGKCEKFELEGTEVQIPDWRVNPKGKVKYLNMRYTFDCQNSAIKKIRELPKD